MADKNVDAEITVEFEEVTSRQQLISGEKICTLFSKITKIFSDLKAICFSGSYNDLSDTPDIVTKEYLDPIKSQATINKSTLGYQCKNLLKNTASTSTVSGITFTVNDDGSVTLNGTSTGQILYPLMSDGFENIIGKKCILTGCPANGSDSTFGIYIRAGSSKYIQTNGSAVTFTTNSINWIDIVVRDGVTFDNVTFYPMIRYADIIDDTYEPYKESVDERVSQNTSDIVVSKSDIAFSRTTLGYQCKNLLNLKSKVGTYTSNGIAFVINDDGSITANGTATANVFFYMIRNDSALGNLIYGKEVKLTGCPEGGSASTYSLRSLNVNGNSGAVADLGNGRVFTYTNTEKSASFYIAISEGVTVTDLTFYPMLRYSEITDDSFEIYKPSLQEQINSKAKSKILYSSDTGSRIVTLSEAPSNYDYLMIFISGIGAGTQCINIPGSGNFHNAIITGNPTPTQSNTPYLIGVLATLSDINKTVALTYGEKVSITSSGNSLEDIPSTTGYITKVIGFKSI